MDAKQHGKRLRKAREARGCTVKELSEMLGIHFQYLHMLERGERLPSLSTLRKSARLLDVSADWLLGLTRTGGPKRKRE